MDDKEKESEELSILFGDKSKEIKEKQQELQLYEINNTLYYKKATEEKINNKTIEKEALIKALDISDLKAKADELNNEIEIEWDKTKTHWINTDTQYNGYINHTKGIMEENKNKRKKYYARLHELQNEVNKFQIKEEGLVKYKDKLSQYYDLMSLAFPQGLVEDLIKIKEKSDKEIVDLSKDINLYQERISVLKSEINKNNYILDEKIKVRDLLKKEIKKEEEYEFKLARRVTKQLLQNYDGSLLDHAWFNKKLEELEYMEANKRKNLQDLQRTIWEKSIDKLLNKEDYFIPNKDIVLIKDEIKKIGIHVETGLEYLRGLDDKEKLEIINNYPCNNDDYEL